MCKGATLEFGYIAIGKATCRGVGVTVCTLYVCIAGLDAEILLFLEFDPH